MEQPTTTVLTKVWWESKTLWLNLLGFVALVVGITLEQASLLDLPSQAVAYLGLALALANGILRFVSNTPLANGSGQTAELPAPRIFTEQVTPRG